MLRILVTSVFALSFAALAAQAESRDVDNLFRLQVPTGWQDRTASDKIKLLITSPRFAETHGNCNIIAIDMPELADTSQEVLNAAGGEVFTKAFWTEQLAQSKLQNADIEKSGSRRKGEREIWYTRVSADYTLPDGSSVRLTQLQDAHLVPGHMFAVTCTASAASVAREEDDFSTIMTSFEPIVAAPSVMLEPKNRPSLTLYEGTQFAGVSRVVTQDVTDLAQFGWSRAAASFSSAGAGAWQVCDRANFSGRCQTLSGSSPSLPTFIAVSARHVVAPAGSFAAAGNAAREAARAGVLATTGR
jgi:hypothetical protein